MTVNTNFTIKAVETIAFPLFFCFWSLRTEATDSTIIGVFIGTRTSNPIRMDWYFCVVIHSTCSFGKGSFNSPRQKSGLSQEIGGGRELSQQVQTFAEAN